MRTTPDTVGQPALPLLGALPGLALRAGLSLLASLLSPEGCAACDAEVAMRTVFCPACASTVVRAERPEPRASVAPLRTDIVAFAEFGEAVAKALRRLKYAGRADLARPLGDLLRHAARDASVKADLVVPVPLHPRRLAERGYNQAALLARPLARELGARLLPRALARTRNTPQQVSLDREARLENVARAFEPRDPSAVCGKHVVLVDDVATTGATLSACSDALARAGAASVIAVVVARAS